MRWESSTTTRGCRLFEVPAGSPAAAIVFAPMISATPPPHPGCARLMGLTRSEWRSARPPRLVTSRLCLRRHGSTAFYGPSGLTALWTDLRSRVCAAVCSAISMTGTSRPPIYRGTSSFHKDTFDFNSYPHKFNHSWPPSGAARLHDRDRFHGRHRDGARRFVDADGASHRFVPRVGDSGKVKHRATAHRIDGAGGEYRSGQNVADTATLMAPVCGLASGLGKLSSIA